MWTVTRSSSSSSGTTTTETDAAGVTTVKAEASGSTTAVEDAQKENKAVTVPVEVKATTDTKSVPVVSVSIPKSADKVKVEVPVINLTSGTVAVLVHADGTEEIVKTCTNGKNGAVLNVSGGVTVKIVDNFKNFNDTASHWSKDEVNFAVSREIFNGVGNNNFGVSAPMTRGMVNTVLARLSGADNEGSANWHDKGNEWAVRRHESDRQRDVRTACDHALPLHGLSRSHRYVELHWRGQRQQLCAERDALGKSGRHHRRTWRRLRGSHRGRRARACGGHACEIYQADRPTP